MQVRQLIFIQIVLTLAISYCADARHKGKEPRRSTRESWHKPLKKLILGNRRNEIKSKGSVNEKELPSDEYLILGTQSGDSVDWDPNWDQGEIQFGVHEGKGLEAELITEAGHRIPKPPTEVHAQLSSTTLHEPISCLPDINPPVFGYDSPVPVQCPRDPASDFPASKHTPARNPSAGPINNDVIDGSCLRSGEKIADYASTVYNAENYYSMDSASSHVRSFDTEIPSTFPQINSWKSVIHESPIFTTYQPRNTQFIETELPGGCDNTKAPQVITPKIFKHQTPTPLLLHEDKLPQTYEVSTSISEQFPNSEHFPHDYPVPYCPENFETQVLKNGQFAYNFETDRLQPVSQKYKTSETPATIAYHSQPHDQDNFSWDCTETTLPAVISKHNTHETTTNYSPVNQCLHQEKVYNYSEITIPQVSYDNNETPTAFHQPQAQFYKQDEYPQISEVSLTSGAHILPAEATYHIRTVPNNQPQAPLPENNWSTTHKETLEDYQKVPQTVPYVVEEPVNCAFEDNAENVATIPSGEAYPYVKTSTQVKPYGPIRPLEVYPRAAFDYMNIPAVIEHLERYRIKAHY